MLPWTLAFQAAATENTIGHAIGEGQVPAAAGSPPFPAPPVSYADKLAIFLDLPCSHVHIV